MPIGNAPIHEMIEEYATLERESGEKMSADDMAADLVDNLCAQGYLDAENEVEINLAIHQLISEIKYRRGR